MVTGRALPAIAGSSRSLTRPPCFRSLTSSIRETSIVGFVGLGNMGLPMCLNMLRSQEGGPHTSVVTFDTNSDALDFTVSEGAQAACSASDVGAAGCDVIFTVLPDGNVVEEVHSELLHGAIANREAAGERSDRSTVFVDCSTVGPATSRSVFAAADGAGYVMMDAPVSGGVKGAADGTLTFMVGSNKASLERIRPYLNKMGNAVIHCGGSGTGSATKLCNNLSLAAQMAGTCEAMNLGEALGIDPIMLANVMNEATAKCWSCDVDNPHPEVAQVRGMSPAAKRYEGGFASKLMLKDIGLAVEAARKENVAVPIGASTKLLYEMVDDKGLGGKDFGVLLQLLKQEASLLDTPLASTSMKEIEPPSLVEKAA